jgi:hypothetical protein
MKENELLLVTFTWDLLGIIACIHDPSKYMLVPHQFEQHLTGPSEHYNGKPATMINSPSHQRLNKIARCLLVMALPAPTPAPSGTQFASPVPIIGTQYCAPYPVDLAIVRKVLTISDGNFVVTDVNGTVIFKVKGKFLTIHDRRVLLDGAGKPIVTLRKKVWIISP